MTALTFAQAGPVSPPVIHWGGLLPVVIPVAGAVLLLMVRSLLTERPAAAGARLPRRLFEFNAAWTFALAAAGLAAVCVQWGRVTAGGPVSAFGNEFASDRFGLFVAAVVLAAVAAVSLLLPRFCERVGIDGAECYVLLLLSAAGGVVMAGAGDLIVMFLGLETLSIALYAMAALKRRILVSVEAGIKYFVLGSFSSAFLLYGIAMVYAATGTTSLTGIAAFLGDTLVLNDGLLLAGLALLLVGLGFKVAAAPFHAWAPDVYQAAPTPMTAFMASAVKAAGFAALLRVLAAALGSRAGDWQPALSVSACATLLLGAVLAAVQDDVKRILAYSSISHAGFILMGVQAASDRGVAAVLFYLAAYAMIAVGSFAAIAVLSGPDDDRTDLNALTGLAARRPALALALTVLLLAQAGVPFTSGFMAKFHVISAAVEARSYWLALIAMVSAVIAAFAYLRVVVKMHFTDDAIAKAGDAGTPSAPDRPSAGASTVLLSAVAVTLFLGVLPEPLAQLARDASDSLFGYTP